MLDGRLVVNEALRSVVFPAITALVRQHITGQPYMLELEVVRSGGRFLLQVTVVVDRAGTLVHVPWMLLPELPESLGAQRAEQALAELLPRLMRRAGLEDHRTTLVYVASRLHQAEWHVYQRARGGTLSLLLVRGVPEYLGASCGVYARAGAFLLELSRVGETFPYLGMLLGEVLRRLAGSLGSLDFWADLLAFARALTLAQGRVLRRCVTAGLLTTSPLVARLADPTEAFWLRELVLTFQPVEALVHQLRSAQGYDAVLAVVLEALTCMGRRLRGEDYPRLTAAAAPAVLFGGGTYGFSFRWGGP